VFDYDADDYTYSRRWTYDFGGEEYIYPQDIAVGDVTGDGDNELVITNANEAHIYWFGGTCE
jgi:hypothetical protein